MEGERSDDDEVLPAEDPELTHLSELQAKELREFHDNLMLNRVEKGNRIGFEGLLRALHVSSQEHFKDRRRIALLEARAYQQSHHACKTDAEISALKIQAASLELRAEHWMTREEVNRLVAEQIRLALAERPSAADGEARRPGPRSVPSRGTKTRRTPRAAATAVD